MEKLNSSSIWRDLELIIGLCPYGFGKWKYNESLLEHYFPITSPNMVVEFEKKKRQLDIRISTGLSINIFQ